MNIAKLMQQAKDMQKKVAEAQEQITNTIVTGQAAGGLVVATMNGRKVLQDLEIKDEAMQDKEELCDLIVAACREAAEAADALSEKKMADSTGGFNLPKGVNFPV